MSDLQEQFWKKMILLIRDYGQGRMGFHELVGRLEEAFDRADFRDAELIRDWYELWAPLEEIDADSSHDLREVDFALVRPHFERMRVFLLERQQLFRHLHPEAPAHHRFAHARG